jgi:ATP synthase I chain
MLMDLPASPSSGTRRRALRRIFLLLGAVTVALAGGTWAWAGLDTARGVLLGCAVVALNLLGTAHFVGAVLAERRFKGRLIASLTVKLGLTLAVLYIAVSRWDMSPLGIVIGLSSMLIVSLLYTVFRPAEPPTGEGSEADGPGTGS